MSTPAAARTAGWVMTGPGMSNNMGEAFARNWRKIHPSSPVACQNRADGEHTHQYIAEDITMITKFDSLYAGHVDLENIGYGGTPINDRLYDNEHLSTALSKAEAMARKMGGL